MIKMDITCQKCGKTASGQHYQFHYGWLYDTQSSSQDFLVAKVSSQTRTYRISGETGANICNHCATNRWGWKAMLIWLLLGVSFAYFGSMVMTGFFRRQVAWEEALLCIFPGLLLVLVGVIGKIGLKTDKDTGEKAAISARKKDLSSGHRASEMAFWTTKEYKNLLEKQKR